MGAPSSQQEADAIGREMERMPRTREVSDRLEARIEASTTPEERIRWESLSLAIAHDLRTCHEISAEEHREWMALLAAPADPSAARHLVPAAGNARRS